MGDYKKVPVKINGKEYHIACTEEEEYIQRVAYYIDRKLNQLMTTNPRLDVSMASVLTSLNLADQLFKSVALIEELEKKLGETVDNDVVAEIEKFQEVELPKDEEEND